jgi:hypothetical protein
MVDIKEIICADDSGNSIYRIYTVDTSYGELYILEYQVMRSIVLLWGLYTIESLVWRRIPSVRSRNRADLRDFMSYYLDVRSYSS